MAVPQMKREFEIMKRFDPKLNPHYDFANPANLAEIDKQEAYDQGSLFDMPAYKSGGGDVIKSPWGSNKSLDAGVYKEGSVYNIVASDIVNPETLGAVDHNPYEFCSKELIVDPGKQLSLQRHRGRQEYWAVEEGVLTVVLDGERIEVPAGKAIFIPRGAVHCMNNTSDKPVKVIELQTGVCREADNVRLIDASDPPRATYPLTTDVEFRSAQLFAQIWSENAQQFDMKILPPPALICA